MNKTFITSKTSFQHHYKQIFCGSHVLLILLKIAKTLDGEQLHVQFFSVTCQLHSLVHLQCTAVLKECSVPYVVNLPDGQVAFFLG